MREGGLDPRNSERVDIVEGFIARRSIDEDLMAGHSVEQMESQQELWRTEIAYHAPIAGDGHYTQNDKANARTKLHELAEQNRGILARSRTAITAYLFRLDRDLSFGLRNQDTFSRTREFVDANLSAVSQDAVDRFVGAFDRLRDGDPESLSQAVTSCRRVLHALADAVCPPQGRRVASDGTPRDLTDDKYRNRLMWFLTEDVAKTAVRPLLHSDVSVISDRLEAMDGLSGKGVHAAVSAQEAESLALHVYLLAAEILRLKNEVDNPTGP